MNNIEKINRVCIAGWGKTGVSLAKLLLSLGKEVKVTEKGGRNNFSSSLIKNFQNKGVEFEFGRHSNNFISSAELLLLSPGINFSESSLNKIVKKNHMPYTGELEFASYFAKAKIIAITGTNGKTTTAYLAYLLLKKKKKKVYLGGNIGRAFSEIVPNAGKEDLIVLEVSSFQLETIHRFRPYIAALLNINSDHLTRHKSFNNYLKTKMKIFQNQKKSDWSLINRKSRLPKTFLPQLNSKVVYFGGEFSNDNFSCVYEIGKIFNLTKADCLSIFSEYRNLPYRQQEIKIINKVRFINDSKSTNPASTINALGPLQAPVILIAGGRGKGFSYAPLRRYSRKIRKVNLIGEAADKIRDDLSGKIKCQKFDCLKEAVLASYRESMGEGTVLFSPMCSSFDMFADYKERGRSFNRIVKNIPCSQS